MPVKSAIKSMPGYAAARLDRPRRREATALIPLSRQVADRCSWRHLASRQIAGGDGAGSYTNASMAPGRRSAGLRSIRTTENEKPAAIARGGLLMALRVSDQHQSGSSVAVDGWRPVTVYRISSSFT